MEITRSWRRTLFACGVVCAALWALPLQAAGTAPAAAGRAEAAPPSTAEARARPKAIAVPPANPSPTLALIRKRGELVVGVKTDYAPFGFLDLQGRIQGFEPDMARELARRLGVSLRLVPVTSSNRLQRLEEGVVDVIIATMGDTGERRRIASLVEPSYYASGVTLMVRPETRLKEWQDVRGQKICAAQGAYFNRPMAQRYLLELVMFANSRDAKLALRDGRCIGYMFDNTAIWSDLQLPEWAGYSTPLPAALPAPWVVAVSRAESGTELERWVGDVLADLHRTGFLRSLEKSWGLPPSRSLAETHELWTRKDGDGEFQCQRTDTGHWPPACRNRSLLTSAEVSGLHHLGLELRDLTGWDLTFLYDEFDRTRFLRGLGNTLLLIVACILGSLAFGAAGALLAESRLRLLGSLARAAAVWGRMTPPLLQMYLLFFGVAAIAWSVYGISIGAWWVAVACLSYYTGASVMSALLDAAALRREKHAGFRLQVATLPHVYGHAAGSITASLVNVSKATMMASVIAVPELLSVSTSILVDHGNVKEIMNMLLVVFLLLIAITVRLLGRLETRLRSLAGERS